MKDFGKYLGFGVLGIVALGGLAIVGGMVGTATSVVTAPGRVIQKTLETNNIIQKYEWFHDANGVIEARVRQIATHTALLDAESNEGEKRRLRLEVSAMKQSCRALVQQYNANATKTNQSIFMGREAPSGFDPNYCE